MVFLESPIAWMQLRAQKAQTFTAIAGVALITVLLFMQIGFRSAFIGSLLKLPAFLKGDLFLFHASTPTILFSAEFSSRRLYQLAAFDEVERITPLYAARTSMPDPTGKPGRLIKIYVLGFPLVQSPLAIPEVEANLELLKQRGSFLIDDLSHSDFKPFISDIKKLGHRNVEINVGGLRGRSISLVGFFPWGLNNADNSHLLTSDSTFMDVFSRKRDVINIGLVTLRPGTDTEKIAQRFRDYLPHDVMVLDREQILAKEQNFFEVLTPIGIVFRVALLASMVIGVIVLYQILFQLVVKYLKDYATLKALGFSHGGLVSIVVGQGLMLAVMGYLPGLAFSYYLYETLTARTGMEYVMTTQTALFVFALVSIICTISALLTIRKLSDADPADLFG